MELTFEQWLYLQGRHKNTVALHLKILRVIERKLNKISYDGCCRLLSEMKEGGYSNATINHYVGTLRLWGRYKNMSCMQRLTFFKKHPGIKGTFSDEEIMQFIELARPPGANEVSWNLWSLYFETLAFTGARPGEVAALTINDIDLGRKVIFFKYTKTEVPRAVGIAPDLLKKLEAHLPNCSKYIFTTKRGLMFSEDSWYHAFKRRKEILGIKRCNITPMSFRHSFATRMLEKDVNIYKVAKILGHDIKMTQQYEHLTTEDIRVAMNKHPLIRKQVKYSKEEIAQILQEVLNDIGLSYDMVTEKGELLLTIRCPCHSLM